MSLITVLILAASAGRRPSLRVPPHPAAAEAGRDVETVGEDNLTPLAPVKGRARSPAWHRLQTR